MQDLPQQSPDCEAVIPISEESQNSFEIVSDGVSFEVLERPILPITKLEEKDLFKIAHYLYARYSLGFTWSKLPTLIQEIFSFITPNINMSPTEKRKATIQTLHYVMVCINPLYLPEKATTPFLEGMLPPFIDLAISFPKEKIAIQPSRTDVLTEQNLLHYVEHLVQLFECNLSWENLATATRYALTYILSYEGLSLDDQHDGSFAIVEALIASAQSLELPEDFDNKLFTEFLSSYLSSLLES